MNDWLVEAVHGLLWNCKATVYQASIQTIIQCLWFLNTIFLTRNSVTKKKKYCFGHYFTCTSLEWNLDIGIFNLRMIHPYYQDFQSFKM